MEEIPSNRPEKPEEVAKLGEELQFLDGIVNSYMVTRGLTIQEENRVLASMAANIMASFVHMHKDNKKAIESIVHDIEMLVSRKEAYDAAEKARQQNEAEAKS